MIPAGKKKPGKRKRQRKGNFWFVLQEHSRPEGFKGREQKREGKMQGVEREAVEDCVRQEVLRYLCLQTMLSDAWEVWEGFLFQGGLFDLLLGAYGIHWPELVPTCYCFFWS